VSTAQAVDCDAFGCIGTPHCAYCGRVTTTARQRLRDEIARLLRTTPQAPEPTGSVGSSEYTRSTTP
jgi:hypothetical protein